MSEQFRRVTGELRLLQRINKYIFPVELWMLNDGVNRNNWQFINLEAHRTMWAKTPILVAYVNGGRTIGSGHNQIQKIDAETGEIYQSFTGASAERIVGGISENEDDIRLEERDGRTWVVGKGFLWAWYAKELVDKIVREAGNDKTMSISIEALVTKERVENGVSVEEEYEPLGVTILGDKVEPAFADAHIAMLSRARGEMKELTLRAASYIGQNNQELELQKKGMKRTMRLSQQQLREQRGKFGEYRLLGGEQRESGAVDLCLMGKDGRTFYMCRLSSLEEDPDIAKYPERITRKIAQVHFCMDGEEDICLDASDMTECATDGADRCAKDLESTKAELETCRKELEQMRANENARRMSAAKKAAEDTLAEFNRDREEKVDLKTLSAVLKDVEDGKFTALCDASGKWIGEEAVTEKVLSLCAKADMEVQKKIAATRVEKKPISWPGNIRSASAAPGTVGELLAREAAN